ncbi:MAG: glycoside hydrolase family 32 protein [Caldilineaceae bacterium]|nr:glycoside hydrolase family 32 protein [Caldilineaceae bacterium]MBP8109185.1 glycoside hydrolase family 32 protein [Caldilineaceae bacterium]MBP8122570.1 glycoside hydrolase family 32 protein [Caldilineaceae bacterium]MBP9074153.1 glycoside hydrolase family 32 protein [Caldilineaceae bacterium]
MSVHVMRKSKFFAILAVLLAAFLLAGPVYGAGEPNRPDYHFTPNSSWMNDPNGMVYYAGEYHLFYQYNPDALVWGPMHWGHAVSADLVNWTELPIALYPDDVGNIFSGSAVIDWQNTAGFGTEAMVAIFTHEKNGRQMQSLAYSTDKGRTWTKYADNPVLPPPNNIRNFRDPKVFWYDDGSGFDHWIMLVSAGSMILIYNSPDLKTWTPTGGFGLGYGATCGVWETPDLFKLPVDGGPATKWALTVAIGGCAPAGGTGTQYFVGDFDGTKFVSDNPKETVLWADYGADFYAPQGWNEAPDGRHVWAGWMNNWSYGQDVPATTWRGSLTIPRELKLVTTPDGIRLAQQPIPELAQRRGEHWHWQDETIAPEKNLLDGITGDTFEILAEFEAPVDSPADRVGLRVRTSAADATIIGVTTKRPSLFVDRSKSGQVDFNADFPRVHVAPLTPVDGRVTLHIFVDRTSVEVFANGGQTVMTEQIFPAADDQGLVLFADGGEAKLISLDIYRMLSAAGAAAAPTEPTSSRSSLVIVAVILFLLLAAGAGIFLWRRR